MPQDTGHRDTRTRATRRPPQPRRMDRSCEAALLDGKTRANSNYTPEYREVVCVRLRDISVSCNENLFPSSE